MAKLRRGRSFRFGKRNQKHYSPPPAAIRSQSAQGQSLPPQRRKTIVVVEDSATFGGLIVALLRSEGYQAMRAWSVEEAGRVARDRRPDLVMVDLSLPYEEHAALVDTLLEAPEFANKPLLIVTSHSLAWLTESDRVTTIAKPFDIDKMLNHVRKALGEPEVEVPEKRYDAQDVHLHSW